MYTKEEISQAAKIFSSIGASKGGKARAAALTPERRREIALLAVNTRWDRKRARDAAAGNIP